MEASESRHRRRRNRSNPWPRRCKRRDPTTEGIKRRGAASISIPWLDSRRSTCLIACLVGRPRAGARPWPVVLTGRRSGLDAAEGGVGQGRACHAGRRRTGRQGSGGLRKSRGSGCGSSSGPANHGWMGKDSRFAGSRHPIHDPRRNTKPERPVLILFRKSQHPAGCFCYPTHSARKCGDGRGPSRAFTR